MNGELLERIFEGLPAMRLRFDAGEMTKADFRWLAPIAYLLGCCDALRNQIDMEAAREILDER